MKIVADENLDRALVEYLRQQGHDVYWVLEQTPGADDNSILAAAHAAGAIIITFDRDFGEMVFRLHLAAAGVLLLRLQPATPTELIDRFRRIWNEVGERVAGHFVVATHQKIRIRPLT